MKRPLLIIALIGFILLQGCYKEVVYDENPFSVQKRTLVYENLQLKDPSIFIGDTTLLEAKASGDSLVYVWSAPGTTLIPDGAKARFTCTTPGEYLVGCYITDKYGNTEEKQVSIEVSTELVYTAIVATELQVPANYSTMLTAQASGEGVQYAWSATEGQLNADLNQAYWYADHPGIYSVGCKITDKYGVEKEKTLNLEVVDGFIYKSLTAYPDEIKAGDYTEITANVLTGTNLTYSWKSYPPGNIVGSGNAVLFSICHADMFEVSCQISDEFGKRETKSITIKVTE